MARQRENRRDRKRPTSIEASAILGVGGNDTQAFFRKLESSTPGGSRVDGTQDLLDPHSRQHVLLEAGRPGDIQKEASRHRTALRYLHSLSAPLPNNPR